MTALRATALALAALASSAGSWAGEPAALQAVGATSPAFLASGTAVATPLTGDGDAFIENNETWTLAVPLTNIGGVEVTGLSAVLTSSTPGVTIPRDRSAYPNLAPGASGDSATPFRFGVTGTVPCGSVIQFALTATYTGGESTQTFNFSLGDGAPGSPVTFGYAGPPVAIPDADARSETPGVPAIADLPVTGVGGNVYDVDLRIDGDTCNANTGATTVGLDHTFVSDLKITLTAPDGRAALVIDNVGTDGNNFCQTVLDDQSGGPNIQTVVAADAPFTGSFKPNVPLAGLAGGIANGTWQFQAQDLLSSDTGSIRAFSVVITPAVCNAPVAPTTVTATKTVSGTFRAGSNVTYTVTLTTDGSLGQPDNPGPEFTDVLPASLTLVSASASSGTAVATVATNMVTWDGALAGLGGSATISIVATINPVAAGTIVTNQGTFGYDADGDGSNESTTPTDDPTAAGANDPTSFVVLSGAFYTFTPCRVLDTRSGAPIAAGATLTVVLTGGACGLPSTAAAVSLNATATQVQAEGFVTLCPADESVPPTSTLNFGAGQTRANSAVVPIAPDGSIKVLNGSAGTTHVIVDINGYFQ